MGINRIRLQAGSTEEMAKAEAAADQDPALDRIRKQLFGEGYVQDIGKGEGIAQYYSGFGTSPSLQFTQPEEEVTPEEYLPDYGIGSVYNVEEFISNTANKYKFNY